MRIALKVGSSYYPLAGEAGVSERDHTSAADFQLSAEAGKQIIQRVRGAYVQVVDRGNLMHTVRFTTARQFVTPAAAFLAVLDHDAAMPRAGVLVLDAVAPDGGIYRRLMASAVVTPPARRVIGATALYDYSVDGGAITDGGYFATPPVQAMQFWVDPYTQLGGNLIEAGPINGKNVWSSDGQSTRTGLAAWRALVYSGTEWEHLSYTLGVEGSSVFPSSPGSEATPDLAAWPDETFVLAVTI